MKHQTHNVNRTVHDIHGRFVAVGNAQAAHHRHVVKAVETHYTGATPEPDAPPPKGTP